MRRKSCGLCSGHRRGVPVGACSDCNRPYCAAHGVWVDGRWLCSKCQRRLDSGNGPDEGVTGGGDRP